MENTSNASNAIHAFVAQQLVPRQLAEIMLKAELNVREQTKRSVFHEAKPPREEQSK